MSEQEQQQYKKETNKRPLYFNKPSKDFKAWLNKKAEIKEEKPDWRPEWHPAEKEYIKETGKLPYQEGDNDLSKDFKTWLTKRNERIRREEMEEGIREVIKEGEIIKKTGNLRNWF